MAQDDGIQFDPRDYTLVVLIKDLAPSGGEPYDWEKNVQVYLNNKQLDVLSVELKLSGGLPAPVLKLNVVDDVQMGGIKAADIRRSIGLLPEG